jgi:CRISPR system Cascade subunit CasA
VARSLDKAAYAAWEITYPNPKPADKPSQLARFDARGEHWENTAEPFQILLEGTMAIDPDDPADGAQLRDLVDEYAATVATAAVGFLTKRLDSLPRNSQGSKTRARALRRLMDELSASGAPPEIRAAVRQEDPE